MCGGSRGRIRRMRTSSIAADDMWVFLLSDWIACACGVRARATSAVLYCAAVGCMNNCWNCCSVVLGCTTWRCLLFDVVVVLCFFCGSAGLLPRLRLYMMSCCCLTLSVVVVPHFFHSWSLPSASCRSCSHLSVCLCSVSSTLIRVGRLPGVSCRILCAVSLRRSSVSASLFRSSHTLCEC